jgi:hypothetical protein
VKLHLGCAGVNIWLAASMDLLLAWDKVAHVLPGFVLSNVFAHAHLAALGWVTMMIVGVGYRLLPMTFPSKMPAGRSLYASALLLEAGILGLFAALLLRSTWALLFGLVIVAGLAAFISHVAWMVRRPAPKPVGAPRIDFAIFHAASAGVSLVIAAAIGLALLVLPPSPATLHAAAAYGVFGLIGFLAQMVVAMEVRLLPMVTWFWAYERSGFQVAPPSPHVMRERSWQLAVFVAWTVGVPALAAGLWLESARLVGAGALSLLVGVLFATLDNASVVAQARQKRAA